MISGSDKRLVVIINKIDTTDIEAVNRLKDKIYLEKDDSLMFISAKKHTGLDDLRTMLGKIIDLERFKEEDVIITNLRHFDALKRVSESLGRVISGFNEQLPEDLIAIDIRHAIHYLGEITGEITTDEILGNIFKNFCIGK
jgi:tRNA modification GTPase